MKTALALFLAMRVAGGRPDDASAKELWKQVEIVRTAHGVPHIRAENIRAAGYALAWLQLEDYGPQTAMNVVKARGGLARLFGRDSIESDFFERPGHTRAEETFATLELPTREMYAGFAAGINRYVVLHPEEFPKAMPHDFTGVDIAAGDIGRIAPAAIRHFLAKMNPAAAPRDPAERADDFAALDNDNVGSNAWALAPSRTKSGKAILLRNPHLVWTAGYYEAHMTVPGVVDFYGDFRIGGPFAVVGGFNKNLGWATTNNAQELNVVYALDADPKRRDRYLFDGKSVRLRREVVKVAYASGKRRKSEARESWYSALGPVIYRSSGKIYVMKTADDGEYRSGEQFLRMMRATSLAEWKAAMAMRARPTSNFTYADAAGNIFFVWNAALPVLPHPPGGDTTAFIAHGAKDVWSRYVPFDSLPQFLNPPGGYVHNENSSPHFTNFGAPIDTTNAYPNFQKPEFSLRSQLALQLVGGTDKLSLEDVVTRKHSYRMLLADRVKPDLIAAVKAHDASPDVAAALATLEQWDNTAAAASRGAVLFEVWWTRYSQGRPDSLRYANPWRASAPTTTPNGLANATVAAEAFKWATQETVKRYGSADVAWGTVHRLRRGSVDVPIGGCNGALGCFRVIQYGREPDGMLAANGGDGWVLAVEFGEVPRAYSVLAYGESPRPDSKWHADQAAMFARGELKTVAFTMRDVDAQAVERYRPGAPKP
jgi:acyl-homoserine-lactone acylase